MVEHSIITTEHKTWKKQVEEETEKIGLKKEDALRQVEGRSASNCRRNGVNPAISAKGTTPDKKLNNYKT